MGKVTDGIEGMRAEAQALHKRIQATTAKDHAAIRASSRNVAAEASELARAVRELIETQGTDVKQHLKDAASLLEAAATEAEGLAKAGDADVKVRNLAALGRARSATQKLSEAIAAKRASFLDS